MAEVVRGDREGGARAGPRCPRAGRGLIDRDFAFHVDSAAYKLPNPHDHGPGHALGLEIRLRGRAGDPQDLLMSTTAVVLSLTVAASPVRGQQQQCRRREPISAWS
jgi:hypothetical protein